MLIVDELRLRSQLVLFLEVLMDFQKKMGRNLSAIVRLSHSHLNRDLEKLGLSSGQFPFFMALIKREGERQEDINEYLCMDKATTARAFKKLVDLGLVKKVTCSKDHRCFRLYLTEKGKKLVPEIMKILWSWSDTMFVGFSEEEREVFGKLASKMFDNVKKGIGR